MDKRVDVGLDPLGPEGDLVAEDVFCGTVDGQNDAVGVLAFKVVEVKALDEFDAVAGIWIEVVVDVFRDGEGHSYVLVFLYLFLISVL